MTIEEGGVDDDMSKVVSFLRRELDKNIYQVRASSQFVAHSDPLYLCKAFPRLFPFARGHHAEIRPVHLPFKRFVQHLLRISHGRFQGPEINLHLYNLTSRMKANSAAYLAAGYDFGDPTGKNAESYSTVKVEDIKDAAQYLEACQKASAKGVNWPNRPKNLSYAATQLLNTMKYCARQAEHTQEHINEARVKIFNYHYKHNRPTFWITVSPDDLTNVKIFNLASGNCNMPMKLPAKAVRDKILAQSPGAASLAFFEFVRSFVKDCLGWDEKKRAAFKDGGIFGHVKAFSGVVEEQARGSLHLHLLLWVGGYSKWLTELLKETTEGNVDHKKTMEEIIARLTRNIDRLVKVQALKAIPE
jgi:hypothetical protein